MLARQSETVFDGSRLLECDILAASTAMVPAAPAGAGGIVSSGMMMSAIGVAGTGEPCPLFFCPERKDQISISMT
jgi:hypothetical protein